jgi:PST family polysaccharide transporter
MGQAAASVTTGAIVWGVSAWRPNRPALQPEAFAMLRFGGNITVSNVAMYLNTVVDNVAIGYWLGTVALGFYDRAWKLVVMPLTQLMAPINRVAIPALTRVVEDPERYRRAFSQMLPLLLIVSLPGLAIAIVAAQPLIEFLFGRKWLGVAPVFSWLCAGSLLTPINTATFWIFISQGRSRDQMIYGTAAAAINMVSYIVGVQWGLIGVARTSTIVAFLLTTPLLLFAATRSGPISMKFLLRLMYPFAMSTIVSMAGIELYGRSLGITGLLDLVVVVVISYIATLMVLMCFPSGRAALESVVAAFRTLASSRSGA